MPDRRYSFFIVLFCGLMMLPAIIGYADQPTSTGSDAAMLRIQGDWQPTQDGRTMSKQFHFANESVSYGLSYDIDVANDALPKSCTSHWWAWTTGHMTLGMTSPNQANWYLQAFSAIEIDGVSLHDIPAQWRAVRHAGSDVLAEGIWEAPSGPVVMRLALRAGDDKLLMQVALPPENTAERLEVKLLAYPHGFPAPRERRAATVREEYEAGAKIDLLDLQESWILLYDQLYDQDHRGGGPCGLAWSPDELQSAVTDLGSYAVTTSLTAKPGSRTITAALWDFDWNHDVGSVRRLLRDAGETISDDLQRVAMTDWNESIPAVILPESYRTQMTENAVARRRPTPFDAMTHDVVTPHIAWARPLDRGPVHTLVVGPRWNQRETVELAQRIDMDFRTVSFSSTNALIDPKELYLYDSYETYGFTKKNETDIHFELAREMGDNPDCLILTGFYPYILPEEARRDIVEKVRDGAGLLLFGSAREILRDFHAFAPNEVQMADWRPEGVPLDKLPGIASVIEQQRSVCSTFTCGRGRILAFHYNTGSKLGLTPVLDHEDPDILGYYDYYHSLIAEGVLWASRREQIARICFTEDTDSFTVELSEDLHDATVEVISHDPEREFQETLLLDHKYTWDQGTHEIAIPSFGPATGPRFVSVLIRQNGVVKGWGTGWFDRGDEGPHIQAVELNNFRVDGETPATGVITLKNTLPNARVEFELRDTLDRLLDRQTIRSDSNVIPFEVAPSHAATMLMRLEVRLYSDERLLDQRIEHIVKPKSEVNDFHFLVWSDGQNNAIRHYINRILSDRGVDWIDNTGLTTGDALKAHAYCLNAARYDLASVPYITRIASMQETGRERTPCLHDPAHVAEWIEGLQDRALGSKPFGPPAYTLGDENFLVRNTLDVCVAPHSLDAFRLDLQGGYESLEHLNEVWASDYEDWERIIPPTFAEVADSPARWPQWADHRLFMDRALTESHATGRDAIREVDPQARVGFDGVFSLDSWHGYNFYELCQTCDLMQVYSQRHEQIEYLRSWQKQGDITGAWYNSIGNRDEISAKRMAWHLLFHDINSAWYWTSYSTGPALLYPDLRPTPQFQWMQESIEEVQGGIGRLLLNAQREHDRIAVYYSQPSVHAGTLMNRNHSAAQWGFSRLIEDLQLQYDMISSEQVLNGELVEYQALFMSACSAISSDEANVIRKFVGEGGLIVADTLPGVLDDHCRLLEVGQLDDLFGIQRTGLPVRGNQPIQLGGEETSLFVYDQGVKAVGASARVADDAPALLTHPFGKGRAALLNTAIESFESLHMARTTDPLTGFVQELLFETGIQPQTYVIQDDQPLRDCEVVRFTDGKISYVALVRDNRIPGLQPEDVTISLPQSLNVYDMRAKESLGRTASIQTQLLPGEPKVYAMFPYVVQGLSIVPKLAKVEAGDMVEFELSLDSGGSDRTGSHCFRIELFAPSGEPLEHYAQNLLCDRSSVTATIPLALNDPPGEWTIRATDVASGCSQSATFIVSKANAAD
jgi:hypothetical protein